MLERMTVWMFVAWILIIDGAIIFAAGIYYWRQDGVAQVAPFHPSLLWGGLMILFGCALLWLDHKFK